MVETSSVPPQKSSATFGNLRKMFGDFTKPSEQFWKIFGNIRKVVGNLRKVVKNIVISIIIISINQEPITQSVQLPYSVWETAFSQVGLFLDKPFPRISSQKPIRSERIIDNKQLMPNY